VTVYVDNMRAKFGRLVMCHMIGDTEQELHEMADKIGVARKWYQGDHYDIALSKRALAVAAGAVEITLRQAGMMAGTQRRTGKLPKPEEVDELYRQAGERLRASLKEKGIEL
jgi:hypothetical protein